jgi:hypothetical protein
MRLYQGLKRDGVTASGPQKEPAVRQPRTCDALKPARKRIGAG